MNLFEYLNTKVTPLSERTPICEEPPKPAAPKRIRNRSTNSENSSTARHDRAISRYRRVLGNEWHTSAELVALTKSPKARTMMTRWYDKGLVERRDAVTKRDNSRYEWRMK